MTIPRRPIHSYDVEDLFAGPGGWSVALRDQGFNEIGYENDAATNATRKAAGHDTLDGDVRHRPGLVGTRGLVASPPCQTFSSQGTGTGLDELAAVCAAVRTFDFDATFSDPRTALVLEPLRFLVGRWMREAPYEWIALEQVPGVLPIWEAYADVLLDFGYSVDTGVLNAVDFGVAQTRKRAVLVAHLHGVASLPEPTHSEPVSMRDVLGWEGSWVAISNYGTGGNARNRGRRSIDRPAFTVTSKVNRTRFINEISGGERRLTMAEAGALQSFPADYPWQGGSTAKALQIGNAIPPLMAGAVISTLTNPMRMECAA